jgi:glycosyltransferase involved in cell wall biosynthesis
MTGFYLTDPMEETPGGLSRARESLSTVLKQGNPNDPQTIQVIVGWHTRLERTFLTLAPGTRLLLWSHGVGATAFYSSRPFQSLLRWLVRIPDILNLFRTLSRTSYLVTAYPRQSIFDTRSFDEAIARWMRVPVCSIGNPIDTNFWTPILGSPIIVPNVLSIGRLEWQKGHEKALGIVLATPTNITFTVLAPYAEPTYIGKLRQRAAARGCPQRMQILIGLSPTQRREHLRDSLCTLCWSETEYQSLAILESLACGCPVIARSRGWLRNRLVPGILVARNQTHASRLITELYDNPLWRHELSMAGRDYVATHHSLASVASHWHALGSRIGVDG